MKEETYHIDDALLVKYLLNESTDSEKVAVEEWADADVDNRRYFDHFKLIWERSKELEATSNIDEEAAWQRLRNRIHETPRKKAPVKSINRFPLLRIAAMLIMIAGAGIIIDEDTHLFRKVALSVFKSKEPPMQIVRSLNQIVPDTLPDGSIVTLNKHSALTYPGKFKGTTRNISLEGEAFFQVTPDKSKPFIVQVNDVTVRVVGTSFNIKSINGNTEVIVETGIVEVTRKNQHVDLRPKQKLVINSSDSILTKQDETGTLYNYYRTKEFECDNTPLWKLVGILNEAYNANIIIGNEKLRNLPLTTTFKNESLDNILEVIRQTFRISVIRSGNSIILQ